MKLLSLLVPATALATVLATPAVAVAPLTGPESCVGGPVDPEAYGLALNVVHTIIPPDQAEAMMKQIMQTMMGQMQQSWGSDYSDPGLQAIVDRHMAEMPNRMMPVVRKHLPSITSAMACAYVREFSVPELRDIAAFAQTPTGKHYLSRSTAMLGDPSVAAANQAYLADLRPVAEAFTSELVEEVNAYRAKKRR